MKWTLSFIAACFITDPSFSQTQQIDSLLQVIAGAKDDTSKVADLISLSWMSCSATDYANMKRHGEEALTLAQTLLAKEENGTRSWTVLKNGQASAFSIIGGSYWYMGNYPESFKYHIAARKIQEELGDEPGLAFSYMNFGVLYSGQGDPVAAQKSYHMALDILKKLGDKRGMAKCYGDLGGIHLGLGKLSEAIEELSMAIGLGKETGYDQVVAYSYLSLGNAHNAQGDTTTAVGDHLAALKIFQETNDKWGIASTYRSLGSNYLGSSNTALAKKYLVQGLSLSEAIGDKDGMMDVHQALARMDSTKGDWRDAYRHHALYFAYRDSLHGEENARQIAQQQLRLDQEKKDAIATAEQEKKDIRQRNVRNSIIAGLLGAIVFAIVVVRQRNRTAKEKKRSDELLLNILPGEVAEELKEKGSAEAKQFDEVTVLFTDFKDFTRIAEKLSPTELVREIDACFKAFDEIIGRHNIEKIKTIGDSYMCAGGLPVANKTHAEDVVKAAIEIRDHMAAKAPLSIGEGFGIRLGVHTGPVVAGIVGTKKFAYDIWGDTVNIASRMESSGEPGKINISGATHARVKDKFDCTHRGRIRAKNKGEIDMYFAEIAASHDQHEGLEQRPR